MQYCATCVTSKVCIEFKATEELSIMIGERNQIGDN